MLIRFSDVLIATCCYLAGEIHVFFDPNTFRSATSIWRGLGKREGNADKDIGRNPAATIEDRKSRRLVRVTWTNHRGFEVLDSQMKRGFGSYIRGPALVTYNSLPLSIRPILAMDLDTPIQLSKT